MIKDIIFPWYDKKVIAEKVKKITAIVGEQNVNLTEIDYEIPCITVRCNWKQWRDIKFMCNLSKVYW